MNKYQNIEFRIVNYAEELSVGSQRLEFYKIKETQRAVRKIKSQIELLRLAS